MFNYKIAFIILHYQACKETLECVDSIKGKLNNLNYEIVIVDNGSPNHSGVELENQYINDKRIHCLLNKENMGFAKGNNIGYVYAKNVLKCDFICCINNDTLMIDKNIYYKILKEYEYSHFDVLAPLVYLKNNSVQSFYPKLRDISFYKEELKKWESAQSLLSLKCTLNLKQRLLCKLGKFGLYIQIIKQHLSKELYIRKEKIVLHGCCLIFSKNYIDLFNTAFDERTFMFREEELLYLRMLKYNLKSVYNPRIKIKHLEDVSTNQTYNNDIDKFLFYQKSQIESLKILISELENSIIS